MSDPDDFEDLLENFIGSSPARKTPTEPKNEPIKLEEKMELELQKAPLPNETSTGKRKVFKIEKDVDWGDDNPTDLLLEQHVKKSSIDSTVTMDGLLGSGNLEGTRPPTGGRKLDSNQTK